MSNINKGTRDASNTNYDRCDAYVTLMWTRFEVKMLISSSLGMTSSSGLLCSNTVSTVAKHEANFRFPVSSTERHVGMTRLINNTDSFMTEVHVACWLGTMTDDDVITFWSNLKIKKNESVSNVNKFFVHFTFFTFFVLIFPFSPLRISSRHYNCFSGKKKKKDFFLTKWRHL